MLEKINSLCFYHSVSSTFT